MRAGTARWFRLVLRPAAQAILERRRSLIAGSDDFGRLEAESGALGVDLSGFVRVALVGVPVVYADLRGGSASRMGAWRSAARCGRLLPLLLPLVGWSMGSEEGTEEGTADGAGDAK